MIKIKFPIITLVILTIFISCRKQPEANFTVSKTNANTGEIITFQSISSNAARLKWEFGDGKISSETNPVQFYDSAGTYTVTLWAYSKYPAKYDSKTTDITIVTGYETGTITDSRDGKVYRTVKIGNQWWMSENLKHQTDIGSYWIYYNGTEYISTFGYLYDWETACEVCPAGWHLPDDEEWKTLEIHLGMNQGEANAVWWRGTDEGRKLKASTEWSGFDSGTNESGFTAFPGGTRQPDGLFFHYGGTGFFWVQTQHSVDSAFFRKLSSGYAQIERNSCDKDYSFSVRCIKNN